MWRPVFRREKIIMKRQMYNLLVMLELRRNQKLVLLKLLMKIQLKLPPVIVILLQSQLLLRRHPLLLMLALSAKLFPYRMHTRSHLLLCRIL
jgi:hypothetical protein